jgi:hypothetical protein
MPTTSTARNSIACKIELDDETGTLRDISGSANEISHDFERQLGDFNVFGDYATYRLQGVEDETVEITILYTTATNEGFDILRRWRESRGLRTLKWTPLGTGEYWQGEFLLESFNVPVKVDEAKPIMVKATLKPHGAVDWSAS